MTALGSVSRKPGRTLPCLGQPSGWPGLEVTSLRSFPQSASTSEGACGLCRVATVAALPVLPCRMVSAARLTNGCLPGWRHWWQAWTGILGDPDFYILVAGTSSSMYAAASAVDQLPDARLIACGRDLC